MTNTFEPVAENDYIVAEFCTPEGKTVTREGMVRRLYPAGKPVWLLTTDGYYPLRAAVVVEHTTHWDQGYADRCESLGLGLAEFERKAFD